MQTQAPIGNLADKNSVDTVAKNNKSKKSYPQDYRNQVVAVYKSGLYNSIEECAVAYGISGKTLYCGCKPEPTKRLSYVKYMF